MRAHSPGPLTRPSLTSSSRVSASSRSSTRGPPGPYTVVLELVGDPGAQAPDGAGGPQGVGRVDVHVVVVDGGGDRHLVGGEAGRVVQGRPVGAGGQEFGGLAQRAQRRVGVEVQGWTDSPVNSSGPSPASVLAASNCGNSARTRSADQAVGAPALGVDRLVEQRVQRMPGERQEARARPPGRRRRGRGPAGCGRRRPPADSAAGGCRRRAPRRMPRDWKASTVSR